MSYEKGSTSCDKIEGDRTGRNEDDRAGVEGIVGEVLKSHDEARDIMDMTEGVRPVCHSDNRRFPSHRTHAALVAPLSGVHHRVVREQGSFSPLILLANDLPVASSLMVFFVSDCLFVHHRLTSRLEP